MIIYSAKIIVFDERHDEYLGLRNHMKQRYFHSFDEAVTALKQSVQNMQTRYYMQTRYDMLSDLVSYYEEAKVIKLTLTYDSVHDLVINLLNNGVWHTSYREVVWQATIEYQEVYEYAKMRLRKQQEEEIPF